MTGIGLVETPWLLLRPLKVEDAEFCHALETDSEVKQYMGGVMAKPVEYFRNIIGQLTGRDTDPLGVVAKNTERLIGRCGFYINGPSDGREMYYLLARDSRGKGYGTEIGDALITVGFELLKLNRIISIVHPLNRAIIRSLENLDMKYFRDIDNEEMGVACQIYKIDRTDWKPQAGQAL